MIIHLERKTAGGIDEATLEGDDQLINDSMAYAGVWERQVKEVTNKFYAAEEAKP